MFFIKNLFNKRAIKDISSEKETDFYSSQLEDYIAKVRNGYLRYWPWIFCVFSEQSDEHKLKAANVLNEILRDFSCDDIYKIEHQMRQNTSMEWHVDWHLLRIEDFIINKMSDDEKRAVLVFASFNPNGYIREQAIKALAKYTDILPFTFLRCNDWVSQIRETALDLIPQILLHASDDEVINALPMMEKLKRSERCGYNDILSAMINIFQMNDNLIKKGLLSRDVRARRFCISILKDLGKIDSEYLMNYIVYEKDPFLRRTVFKLLENENIEMLEISHYFLKDKYPPNRILALKYLYDNSMNHAFDVSVNMLMDKNAQVRELAKSIVLKCEKQFDIRQYYLDKLYSNTAISLYELGEVGLREDCSLIESFLSDSTDSIVRVAIISLMRLDSEKYIFKITDMLEAKHAGIVKTAALLLKKNRSYNCERIFEIQSRSKDENTKIKCATLLFLGNKWKVLIYTLMLLDSGHEKLESLCQAQIIKWIVTYNRTSAILLDNDKQTIVELLDKKAKFLKPDALKQILLVLK